MSFDVAGIISGVKTKTEQTNLLRELGVLENSLYETGDQGFDQILHNSVNINLAQFIADNATGTDEIKLLLEEIKTGVNNLKIIKIEIPVNPSEEMIKKIHKWIADHSGGGKIIDWAVDESIIGGAKITNEGKYADCTLNQAWNDTWQDMKQKI